MRKVTVITNEPRQAVLRLDVSDKGARREARRLGSGSGLGLGLGLGLGSGLGLGLGSG